jgi:hypothetical protein
VLEDARAYPRFVGGLRRFLRDPLTTDDSRRLIRETLVRREQGFLRLLDGAVYANPHSPFRALLEHAGVELGDVVRLVRSGGVDGALHELQEAGVHMTLEELRGNIPIRRGSLELSFRTADLDNPLATSVFRARSGGSRSLGRNSLVNFPSFEYQAAYWSVFLSAFGLSERPSAVWYPPIMPGISLTFSEAKVNRRPEWWSLPSPLVRGTGSIREGVLVTSAWAIGRALRRPIPFPRHLPPARAERVAAWLARKRSEGTPGLLLATPSSAVRVCRAAAEHGLDISGSFFRMGGEPFTAAKKKILTDAGCTGACHYFLSELGWVGIACADAAAPDDVHMAMDRVAAVSAERRLPSGHTVATLRFTSLHDSLRTIFLNVETDDFGVLEERECECELGGLGLTQHLHTIRSVEKLTGEGVSFLGETLIALVEDALPARFGGTAADYQLVERERDGATRVQVVVSPRLGPLDSADVVRETLAFFDGRGRAEQVMAGLWRTSGTLEVVRAEPHVTRASKVLPLHLADSS